jgi:hypothetical protein
MASLSNQQFKAFVGLDWADTKHDICLQQAGDDRREFDCIPHQVTRIDEWATALHQRFGGPIAIALELARGPIVSVLQKHAFFTLFPINPAMLAKYLRRSSRVGPRTIPPMPSWHSTCCCAILSGSARSGRRAPACVPC